MALAGSASVICCRSGRARPGSLSPPTLPIAHARSRHRGLDHGRDPAGARVVTPMAVGDVAPYRAWVGEPQLPAGSDRYRAACPAQPGTAGGAQTGSRYSSRRWRPLAPTLSRIAPVHSIALYEPGTDLWQRLREATLTTSRPLWWGKTAEGEQLRGRAESGSLCQGLLRLPAGSPPAGSTVIDERHAVFGRHSLFEARIHAAGLRNAPAGADQ